MSVKVTQTGPLFDGSASTTIRNYIQAAESDVAGLTADAVREELGHVLRHPTGHYRRSIAVTSGNVVSDGGIIYGPWLEGVSSRNNRSRFKGYSTFRRISQRMQEKAGDIAEDTLDRFIGKLR